MGREFTRVLLPVLGIGLFIGITGAAALYVAFRSFGSDKPRDMRSSLWLVALLSFVLVGCMVLLRLSFR